MGYGYYGYGYGYFFDPTYILIIIAAVISLAAQFKVKSTFAKYAKVAGRRGMTGAQAAAMILQSQHITDVTIRRVSGNLTDHYDPRNHTLNLSESVYDSTSVASVGVAAHECGHAVQHATGYVPLTVRGAMVPIVNISSQISWIFIILGIILSFNHTLITFGIFLFSFAVLFQLVTLPVEFDASHRALQMLGNLGILYDDEVAQSRKVLGAAALTYVAAAAGAILQLLRLIILYGGDGIVTDAVNLRAVVLDVLMEVNEHDSYIHVVLSAALEKFAYLEKNERSFITRLAEGTVEKTLELDYIINQYSKVPVRKMKPLIRNLLRMSVYQLKYMDSVPVSAACNEAVKLAAKRGFGTLRGFVNGVLRTIARNLEQLSYPDEVKEPLQSVSIRYSCPEWIAALWQKRFGIEQTRQILEAINEPHKTFLRCNRNKVTPVQLQQALQQAGVTAEITSACDYALQIDHYNQIAELPGYQEGWFQVQDLSSVLAGTMLEVAPTDHVIDVCAAPGGKCIHAAERMAYAAAQQNMAEYSGMVEARDLSEMKIERIQNNIARMRTGHITAKVWDATVPDESAVNTADLVLADLPCSGLGIMGRKCDIRYKASAEKVEALAALQREILNVVWRYVKPGGKLLYSTCTIHPHENEENVAWFVQQYPFRCVAQKQLLPGIDGTDGFFMALMERTDGKG